MRRFLTQSYAESKRFLFFLCVLCVLCVKIYPQQNAPYLIPRIIFIGDPATLVVPLSPATASNITITTDLQADMPIHDYIDFHKITLQQDRLLIEFTAFAVGKLELPLIEIGGHYFPNLTVTVNSTIDRKNAIALSAPASSLAMPGTAVMLYGLMAAIAFILFGSIWFVVKGKKLFALWKEKWKRWRLFTNIRQTERRLNKSVIKGTDKRIILNKLSFEFRNFLSVLLDKNCRAMTASEIGNLQLPGDLQNNEPAFLERFFRHCDNYRFSGSDTSTDDILQLLKDLRKFINEAAAAGETA